MRAAGCMGYMTQCVCVKETTSVWLGWRMGIEDVVGQETDFCEGRKSTKGKISPILKKLNEVFAHSKLHSVLVECGQAAIDE